jgi:branched-chain amino acid transport system substrate-binding protein
MKRQVLACTLVLSLAAVAACSDDDTTDASTDPTTGVTDGGAVDEFDDAELVDWAIDYTGGTEGKASGDPYAIGYVSNDTYLPDASIGAKAAVAFVNAELGGVGGQPVELVSCSAATPEEAGQCGTDFANDDDLDLVIVGAMSTGGSELYSALGGSKAVLIANGLTSDDFSTKQGVSYTAGSPGITLGLAKFAAEELDVKVVAALVSDNPGGRAAVATLLAPTLEAAGIEMKQVFVNPQSTAPEMASNLQATGAADADAIIAIMPPPQCINLYDAIQTLGIDPEVVTTDLCAGTPVQEHLESIGVDSKVPDGWHYANYGYLYDEPDLESGMATYVAKVQEYGKAAAGSDTIEYTGFAGPTFAAVMTATKLLNDVGPDAATVESVDTALRGFQGPQMLQVGPLECGAPPLVAICAHQVGVAQFTDEGWVSLRDGLNGKPIDVKLGG